MFREIRTSEQVTERERKIKSEIDRLNREALSMRAFNRDGTRNQAQLDLLAKIEELEAQL